ncbi:adenine deaminase [Sediminibacterium ginsengisoli]|uniref:Adenine deaminase n=1 Tax=Sediminibacterium ginsengisoli TaxID=413434 RepID=A0A1T4NE14_9BACT|nr:adenine deaminase [Sediminibacterium ginsengisoli]SJZ77306.1 Adenine deaminase [Sediminibacterium ginsengisoli]
MNRPSFKIKGNLADVWTSSVYPAEITVTDGKIAAIQQLESLAQESHYILPGFTDSHVHIESSMLIPSEFARLAVVHGTVATVSDPHEIANVCGVEGVEFMIANGKQTPFKFNFGAPSCVPATVFETAGAAIDSEAVTALLAKEEIRYLSEMMNFPGVLHGDEEVMKKIAAAHAAGKPVDGHAPGLRGELAKQYIAAGISTDHECFTAEEALDKIGYGMKILIREGSAARNFEALAPLLNEHAGQMMFCSDDKHPDSLLEGHINQLCARAIAQGTGLFKVLQVACVNPVEHYALPVGLLRVGDDADFIVAEDLRHFNILQTYIKGQLVADKGLSLIEPVDCKPINHFDCKAVSVKDLQVNEHEYPSEKGLIPVMEALDGQLITNRLDLPGKLENGQWQSDTANDILKLVVVNRYHQAPVAKCFIRNFGFTKGAIASSVAHDSHNIVAVGADDESLARAINLVIAAKGGVSCVSGTEESVLDLPVAGLMSTKDGYEVATAYTAIDKMAKQLGSGLQAPFMTLSFMALLVIPHLKLSDKGLFDGDAFRFIP